MPRFLCLRLDPPSLQKKDSHRRPLWIGTDLHTIPRDQNVKAGTECMTEKWRRKIYGPHLR